MEEQRVSFFILLYARRCADPSHPCSYRDDWAAKHFLHPKTLRKAREVRTQLLDIMKHQKLDIIPCGTDWDVIRCASFALSLVRSLSLTVFYHPLHRKTICAAYFHQAARVKGIGEYQHVRTGVSDFVLRRSENSS